MGFQLVALDVLFGGPYAASGRFELIEFAGQEIDALVLNRREASSHPTQEMPRVHDHIDTLREPLSRIEEVQKVNDLGNVPGEDGPVDEFPGFVSIVHHVPTLFLSS
jgi:hypothetical protein